MSYGDLENFVLTMFYQSKIKEDLYLYSVKTKFNNWDKSFFNSLGGKKLHFIFSIEKNIYKQ